MTLSIPRARNGRPLRVFGSLGDRDEPTASAITAAIRGINSAFGEFRTKNDAAISELRENQEELNRRVAAASMGGFVGEGSAGRLPRLSDDVRQGIVDVLRGRISGLPEMAHTIGDDTSGGYGVVPQLDPFIDPTVRRQNALRRLARSVTLPLGVGSYQKMIPTRGSGAAWASEVQTRSETTNAAFGRIEITPREAYAYVPVSQWLLDDNGVGLEEWLSEDVASAIFELEGAAFINGQGGNQPRGLVTYDVSSELDDTVRPFGTIAYVPSGVSGGFIAGGSPAASPADVLIDLTLALDASYRANGNWLMSSSTAGVIRKFKDADGRFVWTDSLIAGQPAQLLGYPVEIDESMPAIDADSLSIAFGDFRRAYAIVDRPGIRLVSDPYTTPGTVKSYWFKRVGGGLADSRAVKFLKLGTS
ncbi:MAG: phage major capsid protein [Amphiplicatus sp.]